MRGSWTPWWCAAVLVLGTARPAAAVGRPPAPPGGASPEAFAEAPATLPLATALSLSVPPVESPTWGARVTGSGNERRSRDHSAALTTERARILLRSLTLPGWGEATVGKRTSATLFALAETGVWASFTAFRIQGLLRRQSYERTARLMAGIDLHGRDEEFRRIVGSYLSSDQYNQYVVFRDAANLYYDNPTLYRQYIAEHELKGVDTWNWGTVDALLRYRGQRKDAQRAQQRANTALAAAAVNRLLSALHAARAAGHRNAEAGDRPSWNLEVVPSDPDDPTAFRLGVRTRF